MFHRTCSEVYKELFPEKCEKVCRDPRKFDRGWRRSAQHWNAIIQHHKKTVRAVWDLGSVRRNELQMIRHCDLVSPRNRAREW